MTCDVRTGQAARRDEVTPGGSVRLPELPRAPQKTNCTTKKPIPAPTSSARMTSHPPPKSPCIERRRGCAPDPEAQRSPPSWDPPKMLIVGCRGPIFMFIEPLQQNDPPVRLPPTHHASFSSSCQETATSPGADDRATISGVCFVAVSGCLEARMAPHKARKRLAGWLIMLLSAGRVGSSTLTRLGTGRRACQSRFENKLGLRIACCRVSHPSWRRPTRTTAVVLSRSPAPASVCFNTSCSD